MPPSELSFRTEQEPVSGWNIRVQGFDGNEEHTEVPDFGEQPVQRSLVRNCTAEACGAVVFTGQGEALEPGFPAVLEVAVDPEPVAVGNQGSG
jgi:hypothetical protein